MGIRFGPSGNSDTFYEQGHKHTWQVFEWIAAMGLSAYEYSFGRGVRIGQAAAQKIGEAARQHGIALSVHAPYYINLVTQDPEKQQKNIQYILDSARAAQWMGADRVVIHPGSTKDLDRAQSTVWATQNLLATLHVLRQNDLSHMAVCPETMGKLNQFGNLPEVLALCAADDTLLPTIDFGHLNARSLGKLITREDYAQVLDAIQAQLGEARLRDMHCHFSRIEYTKQGEKRHLTFADTQYGPDFAPLAQELAARRLAPRVICESKGTMAEDAVTMKQLYETCITKED